MKRGRILRRQEAQNLPWPPSAGRMKVTARDAGKTKAPAMTPPCDIAKAMGEDAWRRLDPAIRPRFEKLAAHGATVTYGGVMHVVECSLFGKLLAYLSRLIGTPLAPYRGRNVETEVAVYADRNSSGTVWERRYGFDGRAPVSVRSTKVLDKHNQLLECVGAGFGMELRVFERDGALHFVSERYFWDRLGRRIYLPDLLTPGRAHVTHTDLGGGNFRFRITMTHRLLGETFFQEGDFRETSPEWENSGHG